MALVMAVSKSRKNASVVLLKSALFLSLALVFGPAILAARAQSGGNTAPSQSAAQSPAAQDIPDAPSTVQPPPPKPEPLPDMPPGEGSHSGQPTAPASDSAQPSDKQTPPVTQQGQPAPTGAVPRNQINPAEGLYTLKVVTNFVQIPVSVKDRDGRRVDGLFPKDFTVLENGKKQTLKFFSSDPFQLSAAVILDVGMPDIAVQQIAQTFTALEDAFSPYDEVALYTYSSTVSQVVDFSSHSEQLTAALNQLKLVHGHNAGPPVLGGPLASGPTVNGAPVGGPTIAPVNTPEREAHVLNDAILRATIDLGKRDRTRRKIIFVISDGRELGSRSNYRQVLKLLETRDIQVRAVVVDSGALPGFRQAAKIHLPSHGSNIPFVRGQGYSDILPRYVYATCGGHITTELTREGIEEAYVELATEARNQYTLGYSPEAVNGSSAYRSIDVIVDKKGLKVSAKDGYYPTSTSR
jgi:VWFA-related protein